MARPKLGDGETERLHVKISTEELTSIDDWRFANRIASRSEAVRRLCKIGLLTSDEIANLFEHVGNLCKAAAWEHKQVVQALYDNQFSESKNEVLQKTLEKYS